jgi:hypothetical protein
LAHRFALHPQIKIDKNRGKENSHTLMALTEAPTQGDAFPGVTRTQSSKRHPPLVEPAV